jgi:hypothetical protein
MHLLLPHARSASAFYARFHGDDVVHANFGVRNVRASWSSPFSEGHASCCTRTGVLFLGRDCITFRTAAAILYTVENRCSSRCQNRPVRDELTTMYLLFRICTDSPQLSIIRGYEAAVDQ